MPCTQALVCLPLDGVNYFSWNPPAHHMTALNRQAVLTSCLTGYCITTGSSADSIFEELQVWRDADHDGVSDAGELASLSDSGLEWIALDYGESSRVDEHGNAFRYWASSGWSDGTTRNVWNVFLVGG